jgi:hypothetical protein
MIDETADKFREQAKAQEGQPKPPSPEMQKAQMDNQAKTQQIQMSAQLEMQKMQAQNELEKAKQEYQAQENQLKFQLEEQRNAQDREMEAKLEQMKIEAQTNKDLLLAYIDNAAKIETTRISSGLDSGEAAYADNVQMANILQDQLGYSNMKNHPLQPVIENMHNSNQQMTQMLSALMAKLNQPKQVIRDQNGKIVGVQ